MKKELSDDALQESPESLLRSALQGKGYAKTVHLQNGITVIPAQNSVKDEELRRVLFTNDQVRDSTLFLLILLIITCFTSFAIVVFVFFSKTTFNSG